MKRAMTALLCLAVLTGCGSKLKKENDALRHDIDQRREALKEHQQQSLEQAQQELAATDSLLSAVQREHDELHQWVMEHSATLGSDAEEVARLNTLRACRDSLQVRFEVLCQTIKYIRQKQKE